MPHGAIQSRNIGGGGEKLFPSSFERESFCTLTPKLQPLHFPSSSARRGAADGSLFHGEREREFLIDNLLV